MKRFIVVCAVVGLLAGAGTASALSISDLQAQVQALLARIAALQAQQSVSVVPSTGVATSAAPDSCQTWYDGCNTCTRSYPGGPLSCTEVQCIWNAGAQCNAYFDSGSTPSSGSTPRFCSLTMRNISRGASGDVVSALQEYLQSQGILAASPTGYFGPSTEAAVRTWQAQQGLVSSGSLYTTGWGGVGPRTWAALKNACNQVVGGDRDAHGCIPSAGYAWCASLNQCIRPWETQCSTPAPVSVFDATPTNGSAPLAVTFTAQGYANSWYENGQMVAIADRGDRYIDFGDGSAALHIVCTNPTASTCTYTTTHTYTANGTYTASLFTAGYYGIQNDPTYGTKSTDAQQTITVGNTSTICPAIYQPVCGRPNGCANTCPAGSVVCPMMCRMPDPQTYSSTCALKAAGAEYLYDGACTTSANQPPTISGVSGPTTLSVNQTGTWTVSARDPENQSLSYQVTWGDELAYPMYANASVSSPVNYQTSTFTHSYANAGTYTVRITVTDMQGASAQTSITVTVGSAPVACTMEYAPVCGQPPEPACRYSYPQCMVPTQGPTTYGNRCTLNAAGATYLYDGACTTY